MGKNSYDAQLIEFDYSLNPVAGAYLKVKKIEKKDKKGKN